MASRSRSRSRNGRAADVEEAEEPETLLVIRLLSGAVKETTCPSVFSAAQLREHVTKFFDKPDTNVVLRHAGTVVDETSGNVETLAGGSERLELEAVLQWRFAEAAAVNPNDALVEAAGTGHADSVQRLLALDASPNAVANAELLQRLDLDEPCDVGSTALHLAASAGNPGAIGALVAAGARLEARADEGDTPLHFASEAGHRGAAEALLAHGAAVDVLNDIRETPLQSAAGMVEPHASVAELLLARGAAVEGAHDADIPPLHYAAISGNVDVVEVLLAYRAAADTARRDGKSALSLATQYGQHAVAELMIARRACAESGAPGL